MNMHNTTPMVVKEDDLEQISHYTYMILYPFIFLIGIIGNLFSSALFSITRLNRTSCGIYFLLLAIFDSVALICGLHHCLTIGYHFEVPNAIYCRARNFLLYTSMDMASWMIVAVSVDRYFKVKSPIEARTHATRQLAIVVSGIMISIFIMKNIHLATVFIGDFTPDAADNCDPNPEYPTYVSFFKKVWPWIDLATAVALPFLIISICNALIIHDHYKRRVRMRNRNLDRTLITLLLVSAISFIICNLPIGILAVIYPYISVSYDTNDKYDEVAFAFDILRLPSYGSLALNFYFYYYTSSLFRQQAVLLVKRICQRKTKINDNHLINPAYSDQSLNQSRIYSIGESDDYSQTHPSSLTENSFILSYNR